MTGKERSKMTAIRSMKAIETVITAIMFPIWGFFHKNKEVNIQ